MNVGPKAVAGHVLGWGTIVLFVVLLTLIFSFLGTIICAALAGMMMGAARLPRWQSFVMSLVFPAVISSVLRLSRAELAGRQLLFLSLLCFGVFWVVYGVVWLLVSHEQAGAARHSGSARAPATGAGGHLLPTREACPGRAPGLEMAEGRLALPELTLSALQGTWLSQTVTPDTPSRRKVMNIQKETLILSLSDGNGQVSFLCKAELKVGTRPPATITITTESSASTADTLVSI